MTGLGWQKVTHEVSSITKCALSFFLTPSTTFLPASAWRCCLCGPLKWRWQLFWPPACPGTASWTFPAALKFRPKTHKQLISTPRLYNKYVSGYRNSIFIGSMIDCIIIQRQPKNVLGGSIIIMLDWHFDKLTGVCEYCLRVASCRGIVFSALAILSRVAVASTGIHEIIC